MIGQWRRNPLKGQCHNVFLLRKIRPGPHTNMQKRVCKLFFAKIFNRNVRKSEITCRCSRWLCGHTNFSLGKRVFIFFSYCNWVLIHPITFFHLIVRLKSVRSLQSFPKVSALSLSCPHSQRLGRHCVSVVNKPTTTPALCPHSQRTTTLTSLTSCSCSQQIFQHVSV